MPRSLLVFVILLVIPFVTLLIACSSGRSPLTDTAWRLVELSDADGSNAVILTQISISPRLGLLAGQVVTPIRVSIAQGNLRCVLPTCGGRKRDAGLMSYSSRNNN